MDEFFCKICGDKILDKGFEVREMMFGTGEKFQYVECDNCQTIQLVSPPVNMEYYYPDEYYAFTDISYSNLQVQWLKTLRLKLYKRFDLELLKPVYADWMKNLNAGEHEKIADIGCGNGQLLYELYSSGFKNLKGYDPFIMEDNRVNKGLEIYKREIREIDEVFDIVMLHHAFEHMADPSFEFSKITGLLKPGGRLLIRVPISDGEAWQIYRENWVQLDAPRHYFIPSIKALELLAAKNGLEIYKVEHDSTEFQFWASELYSKGLPFYDGAAKALLSRDVFKKYKKKSHQLNLEGKGDQAAIYLRKPH